MYLLRYHNIHLSGRTIWLLLKVADLNRLPTNMRCRWREERYRRYEKPLPGHQIQLDVEFPGARRPSPAAVRSVHCHR